MTLLGLRPAVHYLLCASSEMIYSEKNLSDLSKMLLWAYLFAFGFGKKDQSINFEFKNQTVEINSCYNLFYILLFNHIKTLLALSPCFPKVFRLSFLFILL